MKRALSLLMLSLAACNLHADEEMQVNLYLSADTSSPIITTVRADSPILENTGMILDADKREAGWRFTEVNTYLRGFVRPERIGSNFTLAAGTPVYQDKDEESPVLYRTSKPLSIRVEKLESLWAKIRLQANIPAYFLLPKEEEPAPSDSELVDIPAMDEAKPAAETKVEAPAPVVEEKVAEQPAKPEPKPEPVIEEQPVEEAAPPAKETPPVEPLAEPEPAPAPEPAPEPKTEAPAFTGAAPMEPTAPNVAISGVPQRKANYQAKSVPIGWRAEAGFQTQTAPVPEVTPAPPPPPPQQANQPAPQPVSEPLESATAEDVTIIEEPIVREAEAPEEPEEMAEAPAPAPTEPEEVTPMPLEELPPVPATAPKGKASIARDFTGMIVERGRWERTVDRKTDEYLYKLVDPDGETLALVDLSDALLLGSIDRYLNKPVILHGTPIPLNNGESTLLKVRMVRSQR